MPAIDPRELRQQMQAAARLANQPEELVRALREIFSFYADRTRRPSSVIHSTDTIPSFDAPGPVIRQARRALRFEFDRQELEAEPLIAALWQAGDRELKLLAIPLFEALEKQTAVAKTEELLKQDRDPILLEAFAKTEYAPWLAAPDVEMLPLLSRWLAADSEQLQRLALLMILRQLDGASTIHLPDYYKLLRGLAGNMAANPLRTLRRVIHRLASLHPAETAQFLLDEARGHNWKSPYHDLVQDCLEAFPTAQRKEISAALMSH